MFFIAICLQLGDKCQLKTQFLKIFAQCLSIVLTFSIAAYPVCYGITENLTTVNVLKNLNIFLFLFLNKMLVFRAESQKMLVKIANREDPDRTAS